MVKQWGPITWILFHTIAEKCNAQNYPQNKGTLLSIIKEICSKLPCPDCRYHATTYMKNISVGHIPAKNDFIKMIYDFHNTVNKRLNKPEYPFKDLEKYKRANYPLVLKKFNYEWVGNTATRVLSDQLTRNILFQKIRNNLVDRNLILY
tara:strand:+ start:33 stop:479 length:447 start_codon:yes stop_codon:yes gene_type:complete